MNMERVVFFLFLFLTLNGVARAQFLIPGEGISDIKLGADWDEIEWELGFKGFEATKNEVPERLQFVIEELGVEYDFAVYYHHVMWLPISQLLFKDGKVCFIELSSYQEQHQLFCTDVGTIEGVNFWDSPDKINEIYGKQEGTSNSEKSYYMYYDQGLGFELDQNEVRAMFIFQPK